MPAKAITVTTALIGFNIVASLVAVWSVTLALSEPALPQMQQASADLAPLHTAAFTQVSSDSLMHSPLFTPSRKPQPKPPPETAGASPAPPPPEPPRLVGIVAKGAKTKHALLETAHGDLQRLVHTGQEFEGWLVGDISSGAITLLPPARSSPADSGDGLSLRLHADDQLSTAIIAVSPSGNEPDSAPDGQAD
jgi:hypothetical protein